MDKGLGVCIEDCIKLWFSIKLLCAEHLVFRPTRAKMGLTTQAVLHTWCTFSYTVTNSPWHPALLLYSWVSILSVHHNWDDHLQCHPSTNFLLATVRGLGREYGFSRSLLPSQPFLSLTDLPIVMITSSSYIFTYLFLLLALLPVTSQWLSLPFSSPTNYFVNSSILTSGFLY